MLKKGDQVVLVGTVVSVDGDKREIIRSKSANQNYRTNYDNINWKKDGATLN